MNSTYGENCEIAERLDKPGQSLLEHYSFDTNSEKTTNMTVRLCLMTETPEKIVECLETTNENLLRLLLNSSKSANDIKDFLIPPTNEFVLAKYEMVDNIRHVSKETIQNNRKYNYVSSVKNGMIILLRVLPRGNVNSSNIVEILKSSEKKQEVDFKTFKMIGKPHKEGLKFISPIQLHRDSLLRKVNNCNCVIETLVNWRDRKQHSTIETAQQYIEDIKKKNLICAIRYERSIQDRNIYVRFFDKTLKDLFQIEFATRSVTQFLQNAGFVIQENREPNYETKTSWPEVFKKHSDFQKSSTVAEFCSNIYKILPDLINFKYYLYSDRKHYANNMDSLYSELGIVNKITVENIESKLFVILKKYEQINEILNWHSKIVVINGRKNIPIILAAYDSLNEQKYWFVVIPEGHFSGEIVYFKDGSHKTISGYLKHSPTKKSTRNDRILSFSCPERSHTEFGTWICDKCFQIINFSVDKTIACFKSCSGINVACSCGESKEEDCQVKCFNKSHGDNYIPLGLKTETLGTSSKIKTFNLLLLGQTGVGKSTLINSFVNYLKYNSFEDAKGQKPVSVIPASFEMMDSDLNTHAVTIGGSDNNENLTTLAESCTQSPKIYGFRHSQCQINFIDVPGIGDTRGIDTDNTNIKAILDVVSLFDQLHAICILLKSTDTKLTAEYRFCLNELLIRLHPSAIPNVVFIFTNSQATGFVPGNARVVLNAYLKDLKNTKNIDIPLTPDNMYCVDNDAFRFLCTYYQHEVFRKEDPSPFAKSWKKSQTAIQKLFKRNNGIIPHDVIYSLFIHQAKLSKFVKAIAPLSPLPKECRNVLFYEPEKVQKTPDNCYNVLLIGQSRVGKSSLLNAFKNYLMYSTADEALNNRLEYMIPCQFPVYTEDGEETVIIGKDDLNEVYQENGNNSSSTTQQCKIHQLKYDGQKINFIDTPGLTDTRGYKQDQENLRNIYETIVSIDKIHGICFVLKPNESKLEAETENTFRDLLFLFPKIVTKNIFYLFTHTRSTLYRPANSASMIKKFIEGFNSTRNVQLPICTKETVFCFDNEAFRFLCAKSKKIDYPFATLDDFKISWDKSRIAAFDFLKKMKTTTPMMTNQIQLTHCFQFVLVKMHHLVHENYLKYLGKDVLLLCYYQIAEKLDDLDMALYGKNHLNSIDKERREKIVQFFSNNGQSIISNNGIPTVLNYFNDSEIRKYAEIIKKFLTFIDV